MSLISTLCHVSKMRSWNDWANLFYDVFFLNCKIKGLRILRACCCWCARSKTNLCKYLWFSARDKTNSKTMICNDKDDRIWFWDQKIKGKKKAEPPRYLVSYFNFFVLCVLANQEFGASRPCAAVLPVKIFMHIWKRICKICQH